MTGATHLSCDDDQKAVCADMRRSISDLSRTAGPDRRVSGARDTTVHRQGSAAAARGEDHKTPGSEHRTIAIVTLVRPFARIGPTDFDEP
jgi:hypothetical protein